MESVNNSARRALIYNQYLLTAGGGERLSFEIASALGELGFVVNFVVVGDLELDLEGLAKGFGIEPSQNWVLYNAKTEEEIAHLCTSSGFELFVNNTFGSKLHNPARFGIYVMMFPHLLSPSEKAAMDSYSVVKCISQYTELYTLRKFDSKKTAIVVPPISRVHAAGNQVQFADKERLILCVGRFNVAGHNKCQLQAIRSFVELQQDGTLDDSWKLAVIGRVNDGRENREYFERCLQAKNDNVQILENVPLDQLKEYYCRASTLWQFTGFGKPFGFEPEECEHLGFVALDCFAYGTIPMVYHRGGMVSILEHGVNGYFFGSNAELRWIMRNFSATFGSDFHRSQFIHTMLSAKRFSAELYPTRLGELLDCSWSQQIAL